MRKDNKYPNPNDYAVVIGIDGYPQLRPLSTARNDAIDFAKWLTSKRLGGVPPKNVRVILSPNLPKPPKTVDPCKVHPVQDDIDAALRDFGVEREQKIGRRFYFYFSGHGFGPEFDEVGILMATAAMTRLANNIGLRRYRKYFNDTPLFDEAVYILDCCRDHSIQLETRGPCFTPSTIRPQRNLQEFVILAAKYGEQAFAENHPNTDNPCGLLTKAILEALKNTDNGSGISAIDVEGNITAATLREYLLKRVPELAVGINRDQTPVIPHLPGEKMIFKTVAMPKIPTVSVKIFVKPSLLGNLILREGGNNLRIIEQHPANDANPWIVKLPRNNFYLLEHDSSKLKELIDLAATQGETHVIKFP